MATSLEPVRPSSYTPSHVLHFHHLTITVRTLDGADGAVELDCDKNPNAENAHCTYGVLSRSGWAIGEFRLHTRLLTSTSQSTTPKTRSSSLTQPGSIG